MRLIFYKEAAKILGVSYDTLAQAVSRGELTKAGTLKTRQQLVEEQVRLFVGINPNTGNKKRISYNSLPENEKVLWNQYAEELKQPRTNQPTASDIRKMIQEEIARQEMLRIQEEEHIEARKAEIRTHQKERLTKEYPFLMREPIIA